LSWWRGRNEWLNRAKCLQLSRSMDSAKLCSLTERMNWPASPTDSLPLTGKGSWTVPSPVRSVRKISAVVVSAGTAAAVGNSSVGLFQVRSEMAPTVTVLPFGAIGDLIWRRNHQKPGVIQILSYSCLPVRLRRDSRAGFDITEYSLLQLRVHFVCDGNYV
jgi:hypothetical protein